MFNIDNLLKSAIPKLTLGTIGVGIHCEDINKLIEYSKVVSNIDLQEARDKVARSRKREIYVLEYALFRRSEALIALNKEISRRKHKLVFIESTPIRTITYRRSLPKSVPISR